MLRVEYVDMTANPEKTHAENLSSIIQSECGRLVGLLNQNHKTTEISSKSICLNGLETAGEMEVFLGDLFDDLKNRVEGKYVISVDFVRDGCGGYFKAIAA